MIFPSLCYRYYAGLFPARSSLPPEGPRRVSRLSKHKCGQREALALRTGFKKFIIIKNLKSASVFKRISMIFYKVDQQNFAQDGRAGFCSGWKSRILSRMEEQDFVQDGRAGFFPE